jgi:hypothetical protein
MRSDRTSMATWKRLTIIGRSLIDIDLDTIAFMCSNGKGTEIHFNSGQTLTVRESPEAVASRRSPTRHKRDRGSFNLHQLRGHEADLHNRCGCVACLVCA